MESLRLQLVRQAIDWGTAAGMVHFEWDAYYMILVTYYIGNPAM